MNAPAVDPSTLQAVRAFMAGVMAQYPAPRAILFGSRARGTAHEESDADVAVLLKGETGPLAGAPKVEGIAVDPLGRLLRVTDSDNPFVPSALLAVDSPF